MQVTYRVSDLKSWVLLLSQLLCQIIVKWWKHKHWCFQRNNMSKIVHFGILIQVLSWKNNFRYRISSYSCRGNYSFLEVWVRQLFKGGKYCFMVTFDTIHRLYQSSSIDAFITQIHWNLSKNCAFPKKKTLLISW